MRKLSVLFAIVSMLIFATTSLAAVIDFTGGTAYLNDGSTFVPNNLGYRSNVDHYIQDGVNIKFNYVSDSAVDGIIGDYYSIGAGGFVGNDVIHAHWQLGVSSIVFSMVDGSNLDLNYFDLTSNTTIGGGQQTGTELSYITASNGTSMLLPSSDWGFDKDFFGVEGDGIARLWLTSAFDSISSFTVTSQNAYCFGLDNFYINEEPPPAVPEPATFILLGSGLAGLAFYRRKRK